MTIDEIDDLMRQHPVLRQICDGKAQYSLALARLAFERGQPSRQERLREIEESLEFLRQSEAKYCSDHGIPSDYAAPVVNCQHCGDKGWIHYDSRTGVLDPCRCSLDKRHKRVFRMSGLSEVERLKTFDAFDLHHYGEQADQERARRVLARCRRFATDIAQGRAVTAGIGIIGSVGRGKTHLLLSIFNHIVDNNPRLFPVYCVTADLLDELRASYGEDAEVSYSERLRTLVEADLLILDDLGAEKWNEWVENTFFRVINGRMARNKPIAFSTNLAMEDLCMVVGGRIHSRLYSSCDILPLLGREDIRLKRKFESLGTRTD